MTTDYAVTEAPDEAPGPWTPPRFTSSSALDHYTAEEGYQLARGRDRDAVEAAWLDHLTRCPDCWEAVSA